MSGLLIGTLILWLIIAIIVVVVSPSMSSTGSIIARRSEVSFVRTGFLGERVVINGGAFVLPFIHDFTPVNMNVLPMPIVREKRDAAHHPRPHAHRHRGRLLCPRAVNARGGVDRRGDARPAHARARAAACAAFRQVRLRAALGRLRNDDGADARAARRICRPSSRPPPPRRSRRTASNSNRSRSPTSTRPTSNSSIPRTASTPRA